MAHIWISLLFVVIGNFIDASNSVVSDATCFFFFCKAGLPPLDPMIEPVLTVSKSILKALQVDNS